DVQALRQAFEQVQGELRQARADADAASRAAQEAAQRAQQVLGQQGAAAAAAAQAPDPGPERMAADMKMIAKPEMFDGAKPPWRDWSVVFEAFAGATNPNMAAAMARAKRVAELVLMTNLEPGDMQLSRTLGYWLIQTCRSQALDVVLSAGTLEGFEAWRQLHLRFEPQAASRYAGQLMALLAWDFSGEMMMRLEAFEREINLYESASEETLSDAIKVGIVLRQLPESPLRQRIIMNAERLKEWPKFRGEVLNVRRAQAAAAAAQNGVAPMDLSAFNKQGGKGRCRICNGKGHDERNCWHCKGGAGAGKGKLDSKGKSRGDSKSKSSSMGGKAKDGKTGKGPKCFNCQEHGHMSKDCPKKKNNLRMMEPQPEKALRGPWLAPFTIDEKGVAQKAFDLLIEGGLVGDELVRELSRLGADTARASRKMVLGVDSCAATTVVPSELAPDYPTYENDMSAKGEGYMTANGGWVADEGTKELIGSVRNSDGSAQVRGIKARVAKVSKALASVSEMVDAGHRVVFDAGGSYAQNKSTGVIAPFQRRNNVYEMEVELMPYSKAKDVIGRAEAWSKPGANGKKQKEICMVRSHAEDAIPVVAFDYGCFGSGEDAAPILFMRDSLHRYTGAEVLTCKGAARARSADMPVKFAVNGGCKKVVFRCDNGPSIIALRVEAVKKLKKDHGVECLLETSAVGESQSNGLAEGAVRDMKGLTRTLKHAVEEMH
ncbi:unnamed protein product, partial [Prorocentrum cordatum]